MRRTWMVPLGLALAAQAALAQQTPTLFNGQGTGNPRDVWVDRNHDNIIQRDEVNPNSNLARRFDARDRNHDGVLTMNEYWMPGDGATRYDGG